MNIFYFKEILDMLLFFKTFLDIIQYGLNRYIRIRIDNNFEFIKNAFAIFCNKQNIRTEFIIVNNFQINDCAKRFNQTLMRKINTFYKNSKLLLK